jgi:hypothetical protein
MHRYIAGLDLGQRQDYSALVIVERHPAALPRTMAPVGIPAPAPAAYQVRHAERAPLDSSYTAQAEWVYDRLRRPPLPGQVRLVIDETGVGAGVTEILARALGRLAPRVPLVPVTITAGLTATPQEEGRWHVPKAVLVSTVDGLLDSARLQIAADLPGTPTLKAELHNFQRKYTAAANLTYAAWREGDHDDYVLALALALWSAETYRSRQLVTWS